MDDIVCGVVIRSSGKLPLGLRSEHTRAYPGYRDVFGGHVEPGHSMRLSPVNSARSRALP